MTKQFFITRTGIDQIQFGAHVPRTLTFPEVKTLIDELEAESGLGTPAPSPKVIHEKDPQVKKLQDFLLANFKSETGNETPVDCAIRLLSKK
jgi:hypothetical protein